MANNRLYIRCRVCGETVFIGKHFGGELEPPANVFEKLCDFYHEHNYCLNGSTHAHYDLELCEEFPYEMTDNPVDSDGNLIWN